MKRIIKRDLGSDLREINIFVGLTLIIFFVAVGFPTLLNTSPSYGYEGVEWTPITSAYAEYYQEQELMVTLATYNFNPIVSSAFLVIPTTIDNPPPDPDQYFALKYGQPITIEQGLAETVKPEMVSLKSVYLLHQVGSWVPLAWEEEVFEVEKSVYYENYLVEDDFIDYLSDFSPIQYAEATIIYVPMDKDTLSSNSGTGTSCLGDPYPLGGGISNGGGTLLANNQAQITTTGCRVAIFNMSPLFPPELIDELTSMLPRFRIISGASNHDCGLRRLDGIPSTAGGLMTAGDVWHNATGNALFTSNLNGGLCRGQTLFTVPNDSGFTASGSALTDFKNRVRTNLHPDGEKVSASDFSEPDGVYSGVVVWNGYPFRAGVNRFALSDGEYTRYTINIPVNNSQGFWQMKEHSNFPTGLMDDCKFQRLGDAFNINTATSDADQGQCMVFKTINKTAIEGKQFKTTISATKSGGTGSMRAFIDIIDGRMDMETIYAGGTGVLAITTTDHPENALRSDLGTGQNHRLGIMEVDLPFTGDIQVDPLYFASSESEITVYVGLKDNSTDGSISMNITSVQIDDNELYNFTQPVVWFYEHPINDANPTPLKKIADYGFLSINATLTGDGSLNGIDNSTATNTGSLGSSADGLYFESDTLSTFVVNSSGIINEAVLQNGTSSGGGATAGEIRLGTTPSDWNFIHAGNVGDNLTSINFWLNGDVDGGSEYPLLDTKTSTTGAGLRIWTVGATTCLRLDELDVGGVIVSGCPLGIGIPADDGQWHMVTFVLDKGNTTNTLTQLCVDSVCSGSTGNDFTGTFDNAGHALEIGAEQGGTIFNTFNVDEVTVWNGYQTTQTDINNMWNSGVGASSDGIGSSFQVADVNFDLTPSGESFPEITNPVPENPVLSGSVTLGSSLDIDWVHDGINTTGYRIYRTSTELPDTFTIYDTTTTEDFDQDLDSAVSVAVVQSGMPEMAGQIISDFDILLMNDTGNPILSDSLVRGAIYTDASTGTGSNATLGLSLISPDPLASNFLNTTTLPSGLAPFNFRFIGENLINLTTAFPTDIGVGVFANNSFTGDVSVGICTSGCVGTGSSRVFDTGSGTWLEPAPTQDTVLKINAINQTKLVSPAIPFVNDTGSLDTNYTDSTTVAKNTYFYRIVPLNGDIEGDTVVILNGTQGFNLNQTALDFVVAVETILAQKPVTSPPDQVQNLTLSHDNINGELDLTWDVTPNAEEYVVQRISTERQQVESDSFGGESNFFLSTTSTNKILGDDSGFDAFDIPTQTELRTARFDFHDPTGGQIVYGYWLNVISNGVNQIEPDVQGEVNQTGFMISHGTRPAKDCSKLQTNYEQDGWTQRPTGKWFDGNCQVEQRYLGTQLKNLTVAETANVEVTGAYRKDFTSGESFVVLRPFAGGGSGWFYFDTTTRWFTTSGLEQKSQVMNQTFINITTTTDNFFSDDTATNYNSYFYRIIPKNTLGENGTSSIVNGTLSIPPLRVPDLNATDNGATVDLVWAEAPIKKSRELSEDPVQGYIIQRATGGNETTIYDGLSHDVEEFNLDGTGLTTDTLNQVSSNRVHAGQQLNITQAVNITRIVVKVGCSSCGSFNVEPDISGSIHFANGTQLSRSINPRITMGTDLGGAPSDEGFVNWIFSPPVHLEPDEYIFGYQQLGASTCVGGACATTGGRYFQVYFEETGVGGGSDGWAIGADRIGGFTSNPINGTKDKDYAMAIYGETTWDTIGTNLGASNTTFTDNTPPTNTSKAYRVLAFNDAGTSHQPTLLHNPQNTTVIGMGVAQNDFFRENAQGVLTAGTLNYGEMVSFGIPPPTVASACDSDIGQSFRVACYTFDVADCSGNICSNSGTYGSTADANHTTSNRATTAPVWLNTTGVIGGAIRVNGTDFGTPQTEVHLGDFADRSQWDFLFDDNEANVTSMNYWLMQDIDGGGGDPFYGTMGMGQEELGSGSYIWIGGRSVGGDINMIVEENSVNRIFTVNNAIGVPDDNEFHMVTILMDKQNVTSTVKYCVDGSSNCTTINRASAWSNAISQTSVQDLTIGEIDCANIGASGCNNTYLQMDDLAIWKGYQLTNEDIDALFAQSSTPAPPLFNVTITDTVSTTDGSGQEGANIALANLVVYQRFDLIDKFNNGLSTRNLGTLGSDADAQYFEPDHNLTTTAIITNTTGLINESIFQDGEQTLGSRAEVRMGVDADRSQYDFLHKENTGFNVTSINFWINGDVVGGAEYPILDTLTEDYTSEDGFVIHTQDGVGIRLRIDNNGFNSIVDHPNEPPDDGQWHMVTVIFDKGNTTGNFARICIDETDCTNGGGLNLQSSGVGSANSTLKIGSRHNSQGMSLVENAFNIDDLAIWNGYQLTPSDISELWNGGSGKPVIGQSLLNVTLISPSIFNVTITDTVSVEEGAGDSTSNATVSMIAQTYHGDKQTTDVELEFDGQLGYIGNLLVGGQDIYPNSFKVSGIFAHIRGIGITNGTMSAVVLSNVSPSGAFGTEVIEAESDTLDLTTLPLTNSLQPLREITPNWSGVLFNFTNPVELNDSNDMLFGFKIDGINGTLFEFDTFDPSNNDGGGTCYQNTQSDNNWDICTGFSSNALALEVQLLVEDVTDFETTGGANQSALVVHQTFDSETLFDSAFNDTLYVNSGTFGHDGDISVLNQDMHQDDVNGITPITGLIGDGAVFVDSLVELEIGFSEDASADDWSFFTQKNGLFGGVDGYSMNMWVKGNWSTVSPTQFAVILDNFDTSQSDHKDGMALGLAEDGEILYILASNVSKPFNEVESTLGGIADNTWAMVTVVIDQNVGFPNSQLTMCIDSTCQTVNQTEAFDQQITIPNRLTIGNGGYRDDFDSTSKSGGSRDMNFDQLCIWKDHKLSQSEINTLYNSGSGTTCGTVSQIAGSGVNVEAILSPDPVTGLTAVFNQATQSIDLSWDVTANADSYRIYRTSTESVDTQNFLDTGLSGTAGLTLNQSPRDHISQNNFIGNGLTGKIITDTQFRCKNSGGTATGGFLQGAIFVASQTGQTTDATLANSSNSFTPQSISSSDQNCPILKFRDDGLINHTTTGLRGIGLSWINPTSGAFLGSMADTLTGGSEQSRWDSPTNWARTNGFDLKIKINQLNQTKLSADPQVSDTGSSATTFSDTNVDASAVIGETYFYRLVGLNSIQEQGGFSNVVNETAVNATIPNPITGFTITNDNVNREIDLDWNPSDAEFYQVERLSTEREIVHFDTTLTNDNVQQAMTQQDDHIGDNVGALEGEIPTRVSTGLFGKGSRSVGGELERGAWFNILVGATKEIPDIKAEYSRGSQMIVTGLGAGERPARSCVGDVSSSRQDGMTPLGGGFYFDGLCRDQAIFRGNQLHNLTTADVVNSVVFGSSWLNNGSASNLPDGFPASFIRTDARSGSTHFSWTGTQWTTSSGFLEMKVWRLNQTAEIIATLPSSQTSFTDDTVLDDHGYFYRIVPLNLINQTGNATAYLNQTLSVPPEHVPDLNGTDNGGSVDLVWEEASIVPSRTDSGDPIQGYIVQRAGENEITIHDGHGRDFATLRDHPDRNASDKLTNGGSEAYGQQLNFSSPQNVTRFVALISHTGNAQGNVEPTIQGAIWNASSGATTTPIALSMHPHIKWNDDRIVSSVGRYVNVIFDPPVVLPLGEYVFGFIHNGLTCSGSCGSSPFLSGFANQELTPRYNNTNNGDADGFAMFARNGNFPNEKINGTNADLDISIYAESNWQTIGQTNANTFTFTDNSAPPTNETKSYRVLPFNDAGIADPPVLAHDPQEHTINATSKLAEDVQGFSIGNTAQNPPFVDGTLGKLNIGEIVTFSNVTVGVITNQTETDIISVLDDRRNVVDKVIRNVEFISGGVNATIFADNFTNYATQGEADAVWVPSDPPKNRVNISTDVIDYDIRRDDTNDNLLVELANPLDDSWVLRWEQKWDSINFPPTSEVNGYFGLYSSNVTAFSNQDGIDMIFQALGAGSGGELGNIYLDWTDNDRLQTNFSIVSPTFNATDTLYFELLRLNSTAIRLNVYSDAQFNNLFESFTELDGGLASVTDLKFIGLKNEENIQTGNQTGTIDDVYLVDYDFFDQFSGTDDWDNDAGNNHISVNTGTNQVEFDVPSGVLEDDALSQDLISTIDDTNWKLRFKLNTTALVTGGSGFGQDLYIGLGDSNATATVTGQDFLGIAIDIDLDPQIRLTDVDNDSLGLGTTIFATTPAIGTQYIELERDGNTFFGRIYSDALFSVLTETKSLTTVSTIDDLQFIKLNTESTSVVTNHVYEGIIDDVTFIDGAGNPTVVFFTGDLVTSQDIVVITPPTIPDGITDLAGATVSNTCQLSWSAPFNGNSLINGYRILRQVDGTGGFVTLIANTSNTLTTNTDSGLVNNVLYEYDVRAGNRLGFSNTTSNIVDCMPVVADEPSDPSPLIIVEQPNGDALLTWVEPKNGDPTGYQIQRKQQAGGFSIIVNDTATTALTFLDTATDPAVEYTWRIAGWNFVGMGAFSNQVTLLMSSPPQAPLLSGAQNGDQIDISWTQPASDNPINGYKIDRRINFGLFTTLIANTTTTNLDFTDVNVTKPDTFGYRVRALSSSGEGTVSNVVDIAFGSHVIIKIREQDGSFFKGGGIVKGVNSTFSLLVGLDVNSDAIFDNLGAGNFNFTFTDADDFILNKTFNFPAPVGNDTSEFTVNALVFDVDCPTNGAGTDIRIKVNYTDAKDITAFPSTPVCDSTDQVSWSTQWKGSAVNDTSTMVADFISTIFKANAEQFLASNVIVPTSYNSPLNKITSNQYLVDMTDVTINFNLFLGRAPAGGGGGGSGSQPTPQITIPDKEIVFAQRLTGLSLLSRTHQFAQAGQVIEGSVTVMWEGEDNLRVLEIKVPDTQLDVRFDLPPFPLAQNIEGLGEFAVSIAEIPYTIVLPPTECSIDIGITLNCFEPILHTIPLEFRFGLGDQEYLASTEIFVDGRPIPLDIVQLQIILLFMVLIASAVFGNFIRGRFRRGKRRQTRVKKKFKKKFDAS